MAELVGNSPQCSEGEDEPELTEEDTEPEESDADMFEDMFEDEALCEDFTEMLLGNAARQGNKQEIERLLCQGLSSDATEDPRGKTPLIQAAMNGHSECVEVLLKAGADVNRPFGCGWTALLEASKKGCIGCVDLLLKSGARVNQADELGSTALIEAARKGSTECVDLLLKSGANVNWSDQQGSNALIQASKGGHKECVEVLLKAGAGVNQADHVGLTPLTEAALNCVQILLAAGADVNALYRGAEAGVSLKPDQGCCFDVLRYITDASAHKDQGALGKCVGMLNQSGACVNNIELSDSQKVEALLAAAEEGHPECIRILVSLLGADVNFCFSGAEFNWSKEFRSCHRHFKVRDRLGRIKVDGHTPLHKATEYGQKDCMMALLQSGADVNRKSEYGYTALHSAVRHGNQECSRLLLKSGADVNVEAKCGETPLHLTLVNQHQECTKMLIQSGVEVNKTTLGEQLQFCSGFRRDARGHCTKTPLMLAMFNFDHGVAKCLIDAGADVNETNDQGDTALLHARCLRQTKMLLEAGADPNIGNYANTTPLMMAVLGRKEELAEFLLTKGADVNCQDGGTSALMVALGVDDFDMNRLYYVFSVSRQPQKCCLPLVDMLLAFGADVNFADPLGCTALMLASRDIEYHRAVPRLIEAGADVNAADKNGATVIMEAACVDRGGDSRWNTNPAATVRHLLQAGASVPHTMFLPRPVNCKHTARLLLSAGTRKVKNPGKRTFTKREEAPPTLVQACRGAVRDHVIGPCGTNMLHAVPQMGLPRPLQNILLHVNLEVSIEHAMSSRSLQAGEGCTDMW